MEKQKEILNLIEKKAELKALIRALKSDYYHHRREFMGGSIHISQRESNREMASQINKMIKKKDIELGLIEIEIQKSIHNLK